MKYIGKKKTSKTICGSKYPTSDNIKNRTSTIARSMACTLAKCTPCSPEDELKWYEIFRSEEGDDLRCAYCGGVATHLDHLRPLIKDIYPTGYGSDPGNLAPCCAKCNQSKGNLDWDVYMKGEKCMHVDDKIQQRIERIEKLQQTFPPHHNGIVNDPQFRKDWDSAYKDCCDALRKAQEVLEKYK